MGKTSTSEQVLKEYEEKSSAILQKMLKVLMRAQRKVDDESYRKALERLDQDN